MRLQLKTISLFPLVFLWGNLLGAITYEHLIYFPVYLSALPDSSVVVNGVYGVPNAVFWQTIHPILMVSLVAALWLNRRSRARRRLLGASAVVYALVLAATFVYFVPELMQFQNSPHLTDVTPAEWLRRGQIWQRLSYVRGAAMYAAFFPLLFALTKPDGAFNASDVPGVRTNAGAI